MATQHKSMQQLWQDSYLTSGNESYLEELYETYLNNPQDVPAEWRNFFETLPQKVPAPDISHAAVRNHFLQLAKQSGKNYAVGGMDTIHDQLQEKVIELIAAYRRLGHLQASTDPLGMNKGINSPALTLAYYGFSEQDLKKKFNVGSYAALNQPTATLETIHQSLRHVYCHTIGIEYMHINHAEEVNWIQERIEKIWPTFKPSPEEKSVY